jgi:dipeptidyl aminopeptidase/acylaminoacyl peptidase
VLFTVWYTRWDNSDADVAVADLRTGQHHVLLRGAFARFAETGHLVIVRADGVLLAVPFDQGELTISGAPVPLVDDVAIGNSGAPLGVDLAMSASGALLYVSGLTVPAQREELVWVQRDGTAQAIDSGWTADFEFVDISPDGTRMVVAIEERGEGTEQHLWVKMLDRGPLPKLTFHGTNNDSPVWSPDGRRIAFASNRAGESDLWTRRADGSGQAELLLDVEDQIREVVWSADGEWLVYRTAAEAGRDLYGFRPGLDSAPVPLVVTDFNNTEPALSPDGRWLAYVSDESGRSEVYVVPFPNTTDAKWTVSSSGGREPVWAHGVQQLFYKNSSDELVAAEILTDPMFSVGERRTLFSVLEYESDPYFRTYAVSPDDQRFAMIRNVAQELNYELVLVLNLFEELKAKVGQGND